MSYNPVPKLTNGNATFDNDVNVSGLSTAGSGLLLVDLVPGSTTNKLYNDGGTLKFNGSSIGGGGGSATGIPSGVGFFDDSGSLSGNTSFTFDGQNITVSGYIDASGERVVTSEDIHHIVQLTQAEYDALTPDSATFYIITDAPSISGYFESRVDSADSSITANSGYFESRVDSADSSITANSGYFETRVDQNAADIITVSGLTGGGGGGGSYTAGSGLTLVGSEFNVYGGSGNFEYVELTTDSAVVPTFKYQGSGVTDTAINLEVRSSFQSATGSGTALLFQGTQGQLFSITDNLSSGTIFNVSDITGLPMLEVTASGDVEIGEFADNITIHQPVLLSGGVPSSTTNKLYNNNGSLYFNGSALGYDDTAISGYFESRVDQADIDIATVSGLLYDDAAISGYFESRVDQADADIISSSGYFEDNILEIVGVSGIDITSAGSTVNISAGSLSGYFESRVDSADTNISTNSSSITANSGYFESRVDSADTNISTNSSSITANSGYFESRVDTNAADIVTVSGLTGGSSYTAGSGLTLVGSEFNVYGGSGNFENIDLTTDAAVVPKMVFTGSGVTDTPIRMKVLSSHASASTSGTALAFEGTEGQLFGITDNLSSGKIFSVNDITGLPLISADASGDVELAEFGRDIIAHKAITLQSGVPSVTTNKLYNDGYNLYYNGSTVGYDDAAISGYFESRVDSADSSITANSGYFESRVDTNAADIVVVSGLTGGGGAVSAVANGANNRVATFSSTDALNGEANLTFDGSTLAVNGAFTATTKSFLVDHPSKEGMKLQYASLEGPENGVYVRGTTDEGFITLPDYWRDLVHNGSITVTLTPVGQFQPLFVEQKNNREIRVGGVCGYYDYVVYGERKDVDKLEVEW